MLIHNVTLIKMCERIYALYKFTMNKNTDFN